MAEKIKFDNIEYSPYGYITTSGDTIKEFTTSQARPGLTYRIAYVNKSGSQSPIIRTQVESGELFPGKEVLISPTSTWGQTIKETFDPQLLNVKITEDYSKKPWYSKWIYKLFGYKQGGIISYLDYLN